MLEKVRSSMQSGFTYVLVAALTVIFMFFFGMPRQSCSGGAAQQNPYLANVGGTSIYAEDLDILHNRVFGGDRATEDSVYNRRRARILRATVLMHHFANEAEAAGFRVSDQEFQDFMSDPLRNTEFRYWYGRDGTWHGKTYQNFVQNRVRTTIRDYEAFKRRELLARKYLAAQAAQIGASPIELQHAHEIRNTKMNLEFVKFDTDSLQSFVEPTDEEVSTFAENNPEALETYYEENKDQYSEPAEYKVRRVYIVKADGENDDAKAENVQKRWDEAQTRVFDNGDPVGDVAAEVGEPFQEDKKGLMGWSKLGNTPEAIQDFLPEAEVGDIEKIETDHAYMIVKLEDKKEAKKSALEDVETEIARKVLQKQNVTEFVSEGAKTFFEKAKSTDSLQKALDQLREDQDSELWANLEVKESGNFTLEGLGTGSMMPGDSWARIPKLGSNPDIAAAAFNELSPDEPLADKIYDIEDGRAVVRLKDRQEPSDEPDATLAYELSQQRVDRMLGSWKELFVDGQWQRFWGSRGPVKFGSWIEKQLADAVDSGTITFNDKAPVAQLVAGEFKPGGEGLGAASKAKSKKQIKKKMDQEKLKKMKKKLQKQMQRKKQKMKLKTGSGESGDQMAPGGEQEGSETDGENSEGN